MGSPPYPAASTDPLGPAPDLAGGAGSAGGAGTAGSAIPTTVDLSGGDSTGGYPITGGKAEDGTPWAVDNNGHYIERSRPDGSVVRYDTTGTPHDVLPPQAKQGSNTLHSVPRSGLVTGVNPRTGQQDTYDAYNGTWLSDAQSGVGGLGINPMAMYAGYHPVTPLNPGQAVANAQGQITGQVPLYDPNQFKMMVQEANRQYQISLIGAQQQWQQDRDTQAFRQAQQAAQNQLQTQLLGVQRANLTAQVAIAQRQMNQPIVQQRSDGTTVIINPSAFAGNIDTSGISKYLDQNNAPISTNDITQDLGQPMPMPQAGNTDLMGGGQMMPTPSIVTPPTKAPAAPGASPDQAQAGVSAQQGDGINPAGYPSPGVLRTAQDQANVYGSGGAYPAPAVIPPTPPYTPSPSVLQTAQDQANVYGSGGAYPVAPPMPGGDSGWPNLLGGNGSTLDPSLVPDVNSTGTPHGIPSGNEPAGLGGGPVPQGLDLTTPNPETANPPQARTAAEVAADRQGLPSLSLPSLPSLPGLPSPASPDMGGNPETANPPQANTAAQVAAQGGGGLDLSGLGNAAGSALGTLFPTPKINPGQINNPYANMPATELNALPNPAQALGLPQLDWGNPVGQFLSQIGQQQRTASGPVDPSLQNYLPGYGGGEDGAGDFPQSEDLDAIGAGPGLGQPMDQPPGGAGLPIAARDIVGLGHQFGEDTEDETPYHKGVDFQAFEGIPAISPVHGVVVDVGQRGDLGLSVTIQDRAGQVHELNHLSAIAVQPGAKVMPGDLVGEVGTTGNSSGPHLDYRVRGDDGDFTDPMSNPQIAQALAGKQDMSGEDLDQAPPDSLVGSGQASGNMTDSSGSSTGWNPGDQYNQQTDTGWQQVTVTGDPNNPFNVSNIDPSQYSAYGIPSGSSTSSSSSSGSTDTSGTGGFQLPSDTSTGGLFGSSGSTDPYAGITNWTNPYATDPSQTAANIPTISTPSAAPVTSVPWNPTQYNTMLSGQKDLNQQLYEAQMAQLQAQIQGQETMQNTSLTTQTQWLQQQIQAQAAMQQKALDAAYAQATLQAKTQEDLMNIQVAYQQGKDQIQQQSLYHQLDVQQAMAASQQASQERMAGTQARSNVLSTWGRAAAASPWLARLSGRTPTSGDIGSGTGYGTQSVNTANLLGGNAQSGGQYTDYINPGSTANGGTPGYSGSAAGWTGASSGGGEWPDVGEGAGDDAMALVGGNNEVGPNVMGSAAANSLPAPTLQNNVQNDVGSGAGNASLWPTFPKATPAQRTQTLRSIPVRGPGPIPYAGSALSSYPALSVGNLGYPIWPMAPNMPVRQAAPQRQRVGFLSYQPVGKSTAGEALYNTPNGPRTNTQILAELKAANWDNSGNPVEAYDRTSAAAYGFYPLQAYQQGGAPGQQKLPAQAAATSAAAAPVTSSTSGGAPSASAAPIDQPDWNTNPDWYPDWQARQSADTAAQQQQAGVDMTGDDSGIGGGGGDAWFGTGAGNGWVGYGGDGWEMLVGRGDGEDDGSSSGGTSSSSDGSSGSMTDTGSSGSSDSPMTTSSGSSGGSSGGDTNMVAGQDTNTYSGRQALRDQGYYVDSSGVYAPGGGDRVGSTFGGSQGTKNTPDNGNRLPIIGGRPVSPSNGFTGPDTGYIMYRGDPAYNFFFGPNGPDVSSAPTPWAPGQRSSWNGQDPMNYTGTNPKSPDYLAAVASGQTQPSLAGFLSQHGLSTTGMPAQFMPKTPPKKAPPRPRLQTGGGDWDWVGSGQDEGSGDTQQSAGYNDTSGDSGNAAADTSGNQATNTSQDQAPSPSSGTPSPSSGTGYFVGGDYRIHVGDPSGTGQAGWGSDMGDPVASGWTIGTTSSNPYSFLSPYDAGPSQPSTSSSSTSQPTQSVSGGGYNYQYTPLNTSYISNNVGGLGNTPVAADPNAAAVAANPNDPWGVGFGNTINDLSQGGPMPAAPSLQDWENMGPFGQAALQYGLQTAGYDWAPYAESMVAGWQQTGQSDPNTGMSGYGAPHVTALGYQSMNPMQQTGLMQNAELFGTDADYMAREQRAWQTGMRPMTTTQA
jgi:hypothetical protein